MNSIKNASAQEFVNQITKGNISYLSKAITLVESNNPQHLKTASEIIDLCLLEKNKSVRIGITGVPGVGKSTFIEAFGKHITSLKKKVAVLAIDPSSTINKGSILGDKTRMESLSNDKNAFIRPSATGNSLGGVAKKTRETIVLCEAAGFDFILIETVGVGQSEITVNNMIDFFLLLKLANAGDELQGIKRGIIEMADLIVINKADGNFKTESEIAAKEFNNALHLFPPKENNWIPKATTCSSVKLKGIESIFGIVTAYFNLTKKNGYFYSRRKEQNKIWFFDTINNELKRNFYDDEKNKKVIQEFLNEIENQHINPFKAAHKLLLNNSSK